mmetsp:Transcript_16828/g.14757  ORF Transcript_16828/g.14757 Transcript_16828/m.14757 type:complete len:85 (-) Transcript_16828:983-1237(-)
MMMIIILILIFLINKLSLDEPQGNLNMSEDEEIKSVVPDVLNISEPKTEEKEEGTTSKDGDSNSTEPKTNKVKVKTKSNTLACK